jgi:hypothetical protein
MVTFIRGLVLPRTSDSALATETIPLSTDMRTDFMSATASGSAKQRVTRREPQPGETR